MITYATRDDILAAATNDVVFDHIGRRIIVSGDRNDIRYGVIDSGNARGYLVRVDYVRNSAKSGVAIIKIHFGRDDSRGDNAVTFGNNGHVMGRATCNTMGMQSPGQCDCGAFHCNH